MAVESAWPCAWAFAFVLASSFELWVAFEMAWLSFAFVALA